MKIWKSKKIPLKHDVWVSEVRLKVVSARRLGKVKKLLGLLDKERFDETLS